MSPQEKPKGKTADPPSRAAIAAERRAAQVLEMAGQQAKLKQEAQERREKKAG